MAERRQVPLTVAKSHRMKLGILRAIMQMRTPLVIPNLDPRAPQGHSYAINVMDRVLPPGIDQEILEDLADLGLLRRELHNHVNLCPQCHQWQINFRETCPYCDSIDLEVESMLHHFRCAYSGLKSEFVSGIDLICPKCRNRLHQLGQDFEHPHDTYICRDCRGLFEEPVIEGQCLNCSTRFAGADVEVGKIYRYRPTLLASRAVELERLTCLDLGEMLFDPEVQLTSKEFLFVEAEREYIRLRRYGCAFGGAVLSFSLHDQPYPIFRNWNVRAIRELSDLLVDVHRELDLVSRLDNTHIGLLLPETHLEGLDLLRERIMDQLEEMCLTSHCGNPLSICWEDQAWEEPGEVTVHQVLSFFDRRRDCP